MAQTNYIDSSAINYYGKEAQKIYAKDIYSLDLRNVGVTFIDGVKARRKIYMGNMDEAFQSYSCNFSPDGQVSLSEAYIEPVAIKVNKEFCKNEFWDSYLVEQTTIALNAGIPQSFAEWYFVRLREEMSREYAAIAWQGDTARTATTKPYLKVTDGWEKRLHDDATVGKLTGASFTVDNILAQVEAVVMSGMTNAAGMELPTDNFKILMNKHDVDLLRIAIGKLCCDVQTNRFISNYGVQGDKLFIYGFEVVPTEMSRNKIIFGDPRNLILGFDTYDSHLMYKIIDMMDTTLDDEWRVAAISNIAIGVIFPEIFVMLEV